MTSRSLLVVVGLAIAPLARAQPAPAPPADAGAVAYQEGRGYYDLREWDKAIEMFKEAYRLRSDAASLFNIAQAYRLEGDCASALGFYKTYKRNFPGEKNLDMVDKFIAELEPCAQQQAASATTEPTKPKGEPGKLKLGTSLSTDTGAAERTYGVVIAGVGLAAVMTGTYFALRARSKAKDVTNGGDPSMPPVFDLTVQDSGKRADLAAQILWAAGGAAVSGGIVLYMFGRSEQPARVGVVPHADGALLVWHGEL